MQKSGRQKESLMDECGIMKHQRKENACIVGLNNTNK